MPCYVGLDASKKTTSICVLDAHGAVLREGKVETAPQAIVQYLRGQGTRYVRVGMEAWNIASWLYQGLARAGLPIICIDARHAQGLLKSRLNKTDRNDARGIAELMRAGTFRTAHVKSAESQRIQAMLTARRLLAFKARDVENLIRNISLSLGLKLEAGRRKTFGQRAESLIRKHPTARELLAPLLAIRDALKSQIQAYETTLEAIAAADPVCRLLTSAPGIGALTALMFRTSIDEPARFARSRSVGVHVGLTPRTYQSGESLRRGRISKCGDAELRSALFLAAWASLRRNTRSSWLKTWALGVSARRGPKRAIVATARKLAVILHRMWVTGIPFQWEAVAA